MPIGQGARNTIILGGLGRPQLFDTNVKATSIDEDIFTDQEVITAAQDADLILVLDVSDTPDQIKYITRENLFGSALVAISGNVDNRIPTATGTALQGEANLLFDGTILTNDGGEVNIDISSGDPHLSFQIGGTDEFTIGVDDSDSDILKIDTGGTVGGATKLSIDTSGNVIISGGLTMGSTSFVNSSGVIQVAAQTSITSLGTLTGLTLDGNKNISAGDGSMIHVDTSTLTDNGTSSSGTAALFSSVRFEGPTLAASNSSVTTTDAATVYIADAPSAGTNQTISNAYALVVDAGNTRLDGDLVVGGDLTISGDDLTMGTNTSGAVLVADGTNYNPVVISGDIAIATNGAATIADTAVEGDMLNDNVISGQSEISSVADDDVLLAIDTSGGGLKKITRSTLVSGLATSSAISNVADDSTPQLGGDLDVNSNDIVSTSNGNISLLPNGSGKVIADGNGSSGGISLSDGVIDIRTGTGSVAKVLFYCESSNAHAQTLQAQPHSAGVTNTLTLPAGSSSTLVSLVSTDTLTNKTLTTPKIAEIDSLGSGNIVLDSEDGIELNADGGTITFKDASASLGTITSSGYSGTAAVATTVTITDNESTDEDNAIIFTAGGDVDGGNIGLESDGTLTYNPSTGKVTATGFVGTLTGNVTGNASGTAATVTGAAQSNITSLGTLTTLTVDNVITNGTTIGHTDDTDLMTLADGVLTVAGEVSMTTLDIGGTNVGSTAAELNLLDGSAKSTSSITIADSDAFIVIDGTTSKQIPASDIKTYAASSATAADDIAEGDGAVNLVTTSGNITIDAQANDADVIIKVDDAGSAVTAVTFDGSDEGNAIFVNDIQLKSDSSVIKFGADLDVSITHDPDDGLFLKSAATADNNPFVLTLQTGETDIALNDVIGALNFQAPDEATGTGDGRLVAAGIEAVSEGDFATNNNATKLSFKTAASEAAAEKMSLSSAGLLTIADDFMIKDGGTIGVASTNDAMTISSAGIVTFKDDILIKDGGTIGVASAATAITIASSGIVTFVDDIIIKDAGTIGSASDTDAISISSGGVINISATTANTGTGDGALTVAGGMGVAADVSIGDDLRLISDSAILSFGANSEVTMTHVHNVGLTVTNTIADTDNRPVVLQLKSEEDAIVADDVIGSIEIAAGDSDGSDGALVAAGIHAIAENTFSASANPTKLVFTAGVGETAASSATAKMTLSSAGLLTIADDFMIKDGGTIGVASTNDAITISSAGIVTFKDDIIIKDAGTIGSASDTDAIAISSGGVVTFSASIDISGANGITLSNDETITNGTNGQVDINGNVQIGSGSGNATLLSSGNHDLIMQTGNSTTGNITITDGANGDVTVSPNGTGVLSVAGGITISEEEANITLAKEGQVIFTANDSSGGSTEPDDDKATGLIFTFTAQESLAIGDVVFMHSDGEVKKADMNSADTMPAIGICTTSASANGDINVLVQGVMHDASAFPTFGTVGQDVFVSSTGDITATAPSGSGDTVQKIGVAIHGDKVYFNFNTTEVLLA